MKHYVNSKHQHAIANMGCGCVFISVASLPKFKDGLAIKTALNNAFQLCK
jgi:hypothetical protein